MAKNKKVSAQLQAKLRKAREKFSKAAPAETNSVVNRKVPDGNYTAKLVGLEFDEFGKHAVVRFTYEVTDADKKAHEPAIGQLVETRFTLDTDEGPSFIKRDFGRFGYDEMDDLLDNIDEATELFDELLSLNPVCKINVAMDDTDQWQNVYLNDVLEMDEEEENEEEEESTDKGDDEEVTEEDDDGAEEEVEEEEGEEEYEEVGDDDDEGEELEVGALVEIEYKGNEVAGTVISVDEENETAKIQISKPKKRLIVPIDKIYLLEG